MPMPQLRIERLPNGGCELLGIERFRKKEHTVVDPVPRMQRLFQITRNKDDFSMRARFAEPIGKIAAAHLRHYHVGEQEMDFPAVALAEQALRVITISSFDDFVSKIPKNAD